MFNAKIVPKVSPFGVPLKAHYGDFFNEHEKPTTIFITVGKVA
jgi:hypothetical protein